MQAELLLIKKRAFYSAMYELYGLDAFMQYCYNNYGSCGVWVRKRNKPDFVKGTVVTMIYDTAIIGTGPAGLSAALNLKIRGKSFIWIGSRNLSDKVSKAECISNYPGFINASGEELFSAFSKQINAMGLEITEQMVHNIMRFSDHYALSAGSEFYEAKTIILATGIANKAVLPGEADFLGRGVSYCATCDGNLYRGKTVAVICSSARFEHEVKYLADIAYKLYYFPTYKNASVGGDNIEISDTKAVGIIGDKRLSGLKLQNGEVLEVNGVFCLRDSVEISSMLPKLITENGHIAVDRAMKTNLPGVFAAGDCTGRPYQYAKAVGEGNTAAHSVLEYLAEEEKNAKS